jgi:N-acyl-D-aspartate/D-glutamate deacylase
MLDIALRGGFLIDGTGAQRQRADIGIKDGRIVALGADVPAATRELDVTNRVVAPGFIDIHTHYDAQAFWDPMLTPSILHGVTTIFGGNCGFSIAPLSPASAHLDMADGFTYPTVLLGKAVRDLHLLPLEEAVMMLTSKPALFYGLRERGSIVRNAWADLVVFNPATIGANPVTTRFDLPAGAPRLYATANGIQHVFVNGKEVLRNGETTGATPARVLRSGQDSQTVDARQC